MKETTKRCSRRHQSRSMPTRRAELTYGSAAPVPGRQDWDDEQVAQRVVVFLRNFIVPVS